jgi:hypothetical protein
MKTWDMATGTAQLELALRTLQNVRKDVEESWDDENFRQFCEKYAFPAEMLARQLLDHARRLTQVFADARRDLDD